MIVDERAARVVARLSPREFASRYRRLTTRADQDQAIRLRGRYDVLFFARYCWPDLFSLPWNAYHRAELAEPLPPFHERTGHDLRSAVAAPRGVAKTTLAKARIAHAMAYGLDPYVVVLSAGLDLALEISRHVAQMLRDQDGELHRVWGPVQVSGPASKWTARWPDGRRTALSAHSFGTQIRGTNDSGQRPTLILVDDGERPDRVVNPRLRDVDQRFLRDDIQKAGPKEGGLAILWRGTVLHPDAILQRLLDNPGWSGSTWQAMPSWPERMDLWDECRAIWADLTLGDVEARRAAALAFYEAHRAEMDRGAQVLDPVAEPLFRCFEYIWTDGLASFLREKQNEPRDPASQIFSSHEFATCTVEWRDGEAWIHPAGGGRVVRARGCRGLIRWDPSLGDPTSDYAALALVLRDGHGYGYVVDGWIQRRRPSLQLAAVWAMAERWGVQRASLEGNGFQRLLADDFRRMRAERRTSGRWWQLEIDEDPSTTNKEERIAGLEPAITNGWLQFARGLPREAAQQFDDWPSADHDDWPDAVEGAWARTGGMPSGPMMRQGRIGR